MTSRYAKILDFIDTYRPQSIIEVGTWNGANAIRMINRAAQYHPQIEYTGYDLFEEATRESDLAEFNVKGHNHISAVEAYIRSEIGPSHTIKLVKGNTRDTLIADQIVDFVFIDGGHSVRTITHDYVCLVGCKVILLDDYYDPPREGFGCNELVKGMKHELIGPKDPVKGGGTVQMVLVV